MCYTNPFTSAETWAGFEVSHSYQFGPIWLCNCSQMGWRCMRSSGSKRGGRGDYLFIAPVALACWLSCSILPGTVRECCACPYGSLQPGIHTFHALCVAVLSQHSIRRSVSPEELWAAAHLIPHLWFLLTEVPSRTEKTEFMRFHGSSCSCWPMFQHCTCSHDILFKWEKCFKVAFILGSSWTPRQFLMWIPTFWESDHRHLHSPHLPYSFTAIGFLCAVFSVLWFSSDIHRSSQSSNHFKILTIDSIFFSNVFWSSSVTCSYLLKLISSTVISEKLSFLLIFRIQTDWYQIHVQGCSDNMFIPLDLLAASK